MRFFRKQEIRSKEIQRFHRDGYLVLESCFDPETMMDARAFVDEIWSTRETSRSPLTIDAYLGTDDPRSGRRRFSEVPDDAREFVYKLNDAYLEHEFIRDLALAPRITSTIRRLIGEPPCICNSLIFERGSQQNLHVDTYYMPPPAGNTLIATSICLEDVHPEAGPVQYVPRSHTLPPYRNPDGGRHVRSPFDQVEADMQMEMKLAQHAEVAEPFLGKAGDVLIWHEELVHGGSPIIDMARTRMSLVTHYWGHSCVPVGSRLTHGDGWYLRREQQAV